MKAVLTSALLALAVPVASAETLKIDCDCRESSFEGGCKGTDRLAVDVSKRTVVYTFYDGSEWVFDGNTRMTASTISDKGNVTRLDAELIVFELEMNNRQTGRKSSRMWSIDRGSGEMQVLHTRADGSNGPRARYACVKASAARKF